MPLIVHRQPWTRQPQHLVLPNARLSKDVHLIAPVGGVFRNVTNNTDVPLGGFYDWRVGPNGRVLDANTSDRSIDLGVPDANIYGFLFVGDIAVADTSVSASALYLINNASGTLPPNKYIAFGSSTGYLTNEIIAIADASTTARTGSNVVLPIGPTVFCAQWNGEKYEIYYGNTRTDNLVSAGGETTLKAFKPYFRGRAGSTQSRFRPAFIGINQDPSFDFRSVLHNPWQLFAPQERRIWAPSAGGTTATVTPSIIASTATVGSHAFARTAVAAVTPALIASAATFGTHTVARTAVAAVTAARIESTASFGTHTVSSSAVAAITATRIESTASFGTATVTRTALAAVTPDRIESTASFGTHVVSAEGVALIAPSIIASTATFGTPVVSYIRVDAVSAPRIESTASFGSHTVARQAVAAITPGRIDSAATFGVPVVTSSATAQIVVERIESTVTFGTATVARTGSGSADPADVWSYVLSNGLTAEQNLVAVYEWLNELHLIHGLRAGSPMMVTPTQRTAASIVQEIAEAGSDVTVTRQ